MGRRNGPGPGRDFAQCRPACGPHRGLQQVPVPEAEKGKGTQANAVKQQLKEIRFGPETGDHDFDFKLRHAKNFLSEGNKVKAYVQFRGRAIVFKDRGELLLLRFLKELEDLGAPEQLPRMEGKRMIVIIAPKKAGGKKIEPS